MTKYMDCMKNNKVIATAILILLIPCLCSARTKTPGKDVTLDTSAFSGNLGPTDDDVQSMAETFDSFSATGTGDVTGPSSSVDEAIARYNGVSGKIIQAYTSGAPTCSDIGVCTFSQLIVGSINGNAGTATAAQADGTECGVGDYARGVDVSWNGEGCTDATTEIDSAILTHKNISDAHHTPTASGDIDHALIINVLTSQHHVKTVDTDTTYTAGDALTLNGTEFDFDGGAAPAGELGGTWASPTVTNNVTASSVITNTAITVGDGGAKAVKETGIKIDSNDDMDMNQAAISNLEKIILDTTPATPGSAEGTVYWNGTEYTLDIITGLGPVLQVNQETVIVVYNDTAFQIDDGKVVHPVPGSTNGFPHIEKAIANTHEGIAKDIWFTTMDIPAGQIGFALVFGKARGLNTFGDSISAIWVSETVAGEYTQTEPRFPNYSILVGAVLVADASDGVIGVSPEGNEKDTVVNFWNGIFRETFDFRISSNGTIVTGSLEPSNGHDDMTLMFSDGFTILDTSPAATITLTSGSITIPQTNYVYIPKSTKVLTVSTSGWPTPTEYIKVAQVSLRTAAATQLDGALRNQNINDAIEDTNTFQGHLSHMTERMRQMAASWDSGVEGSVVINAGVVSVKNTSGLVYQMHRQTFPIFDMIQYSIDSVSQGSKTFTISGDGDLSSTFPDGRLIKVNDSTGNDGIYTINSTNWSDPDFIITVVESIPSAVADGTIGDDIHVVNDFTTPYVNVVDLADITTDASGGSLNNTSFSIVVWGVSNKLGEPSHLMANMPTGTFSKNSPDDAVEDATNQSVYTIPKDFQGVGFLIVRFTFVNTAGVWSLYDTEDLRGKTPNTAAGGGGGGAGVTTFLGLTDTPSAYTSQAKKATIVNSGETALEFISVILGDGTVPLADNWDVGSFKITAETFESDVATSTAPLIVASTTKVTNLNVDQTDGFSLDQAVTSGATPTFGNDNFTEATDKNYVSDAELVVIGNTSGTNTGDEVAASTTTAGVVELATTAEIDAAVDTTRAMGVNEFNDSDYAAVNVYAVLLDDTTDTAVKDGTGDVTWTATGRFSGYNIVGITCGVEVAGTTGTTDIQIHNITQTADVLSTVCTIDSGELTSLTAATPPVIDAGEDDITTGDQYRYDVDVISTTVAKGLWVELLLRKP